MRILVAIPHYYQPPPGGTPGEGHGSLNHSRAARARVVSTCVAALHQLFGRPQCVLDFARRTTQPANQLLARSVHVVICTTRGSHLLADLRLGASRYEHHPTEAEPRLLGFECHAVLRERLGSYDYYAYLEDDLVLHDPWFFRKLAWFSRHVGDESLLQPHRYEVARGGLVRKGYIDGDLEERVTAPFQDVQEGPRVAGEVLDVPVAFERARNPHAGCFFLNARQMAEWAARPYFLDRDRRFIGPLESAATLGVMRTFRVYKAAPENAAFLEVEHQGTAFLSRIRPPRGARLARSADEPRALDASGPPASPARESPELDARGLGG